MASEVTVGEFLIGVLPRLSSNTALPSWPPDCFALCLALLKRTRAYAQLLRNWPPNPANDDALKAWSDKVRELGMRWRRFLQSGGPFDDLAGEWQTICQSFELPLAHTRE